MKKYSPEKKMLVMTREQVRSVDAWAINGLKIPGVVLMENAGRSCAELITDKVSNINNPKVCIFCGTGNNGGDGYVIARHLLNQSFQVTIVICGDSAKIKGDARINLDILKKLEHPVFELDPNNDNMPQQVDRFCKDSDMLVDSIFGTGLKGQLRGEHIKLIDSINSQNIPVLSVDIPSGLDCDTGKVLGAAIKANYTVTFVAIKKGFTTADSAKYTGDIYVASIGVEPKYKLL